MTTSRIRDLGRADLLRTALLLDAAVTGLNGAAYLLGAALLDDLLGLPAGPLRGVGVFLLVFAAAVGFLGTRQPVPRGAAWAVVAVNAAWVVDSLATAALGWGSPTAVGTVWIVLQALVVGGFAILQATALRRLAASPAGRA